MSSPSSSPSSHLSRKKTIELRDRHIGRSCTLYYRDEPLKIVRAEGQYMYDDENTRYLDCINNVAHVGHCHKRIVDAEYRQAAILNTNSRFLHDNIVLYAQKLCSLLPPSLSVCYFCNSGSEANDLALQLAQYHTKSRHVITVDHAYHGHLTNIVAISPYKFAHRKSFVKPDWVHVAPAPDVYRGLYNTTNRNTNDDFGILYANEVKKLIDNLTAKGEKPSAFIVESLISCAGQILLPANYLRNVYDTVRKAGGVCIADEVQVGFGRVGTHWWAFELQGSDVVPDIVTLGKPIGNGYPISVVVTTEAIAQSFRDEGGDYFNTFGGNPVSCAVALAVLQVIEDERLMENAKNVGKSLLETLRTVQTKHISVGDVRGIGLFVGVELVKDRTTKEPATELAKTVCDEFKKRKIIVSRDGPYDNVLKLKPPMVFTKDNAVHFAQVLDEILTDFNL